MEACTILYWRTVLQTERCLEFLAPDAKYHVCDKKKKEEEEENTQAATHHQKGKWELAHAGYYCWVLWPFQDLVHNRCSIHAFQKMINKWLN